jgi:protein TonB
MVKLALTMSPFDRIGLRPKHAAEEMEVGPADRGVRVAAAGIALGAVPAAFLEWRAQPAPRRAVMRTPALLGAVALHIVGVALILLVEWSLVAPAPLPAIVISLNFEPAPQQAASAARESVAEPAPAEIAPAPPDDAPAPPPQASDPPDPPVAMAPPTPPVAPPAELAPPLVDPPPVAKAPPPKPLHAVMKARTNAPAKPRQPLPPMVPSAPGATETAVAAAPSVPAAAASSEAPALLAAAPIVPPRPVGPAQGNRNPDYPAFARSRGLQGLVLLRVDVAPSGVALAVTVATSSGHQILDDAAVAAVRTWRFSPATQAGMPVAAFADVPVHFSIAN